MHEGDELKQHSLKNSAHPGKVTANSHILQFFSLRAEWPIASRSRAKSGLRRTSDHRPVVMITLSKKHFLLKAAGSA
jgi:hypothetical protein